MTGSKSIRHVLLLLLIFATLVSAQTAQEIIAKSIEASGGEASMREMKSTKTIGTFEIPAMNVVSQYVMYTKYPNKMRYAQGTQFIQATDGTTAWIVNVFQGINEPTKLDRTNTLALNRSSYYGSIYYDFDIQELSIKYAGIEIIEDVKCHKIEYTYSDGQKFNAYFNFKSYLPFAIENGPSRTFFTDYRPVGKVIFPYVMTIKSPNGEMKMTAEEFWINVEVDDSIFVFPKSTAKK